MRNNQVSINIQRFNDEVPANFKEANDGATRARIYAYADSNNVYEALSAAYFQVLSIIAEYEDVPNFGRRDGSICDDRIWEEIRKAEALRSKYCADCGAKRIHDANGDVSGSDRGLDSNHEE